MDMKEQARWFLEDGNGSHCSATYADSLSPPGIEKKDADAKAKHTQELRLLKLKLALGGSLEHLGLGRVQK